MPQNIVTARPPISARVVAAFFDHAFGPGQEEPLQARTLYVERTLMYGPHSTSGSSGGFRLFDQYARDLPGGAKLFLNVRPSTIHDPNFRAEALEQAPALIGTFSRLFRGLGAIELPVVMAVDGPALGAGFELALMADVLLATERASFGQPEIRLGFFAPVGVAWLPTRIGLGRAIEMISTGRTYSAAELLPTGLISRLISSEELPAALESILDDLRQASAPVQRMNVRLARQLRGRPFEEARCQAEEVFLNELTALDDVREGVAAFYEKRRPVWKNR